MFVVGVSWHKTQEQNAPACWKLRAKVAEKSCCATWVSTVIQVWSLHIQKPFNVAKLFMIPTFSYEALNCGSSPHLARWALVKPITRAVYVIGNHRGKEWNKLMIARGESTVMCHHQHTVWTSNFYFLLPATQWEAKHGKISE